MRTRYLVSFYFLATVVIGPASCAGANPVPLINSPLVPDSAVPGSPQLTLTVNGTGFVANAVVNWNGMPRATNFITSSQLTATILASDVAAVGTASVAVTNPAPGGGTSNIAFFLVIPPATTVAFAASLTRGVSPIYVGVAAGDFNGDGKLDIVVANYQGIDVLVLLGNGDGTFQSPRPLVVPGDTTSLAIGDFNNDGKLDIVAGSRSGGQLWVLLGNGDGTFQKYQSYSTGVFPGWIAVADFNQDGNLDLAAIDSGSTTVSILLGDGGGAFPTHVDYAVGESPSMVVVGDFNRDGLLDLAIGGISGVSILLGNGDGSFQEPDLIAGPASLLAVADFNGDGILDLAAAGGNTTSILLGNGDGTFKQASSYSLSETAVSIATGDFNGDGRIDLALAGSQNPGSFSGVGGITILLGNGDGTLQQPINTVLVDPPESFAGSALAVGDFDGDGRLDLGFMQNLPNGSLVSVYLQTIASRSPDLLSFPPTLDGTTASPQSVTVTNIGTVPLNIAEVGLSGADAGDFPLMTDTCLGASIPAAGNCLITLSFSPGAATGLRTAVLNLTDNAAASPQTVAINGHATALATVPTSLDFGVVKVGTIGPQKLIVVTNIGASAVSMSGVNVSGSSPGDFIEANSCRGQLNPKTSCTISVEFTPTRRGVRTADINIGQTVKGANPKAIPVFGIGN